MNSKLLLLFVALLSFIEFATASHLRFGSVTWVSKPNTNTITYTITGGFRRTAFSPLATVGSAISVGVPFYYGDGGSTSLVLNTISYDAVNDWFLGTQTIVYTYASNAPRTAYFTTCCRISTLQDGNADQSFNVESLVFPGTGWMSPVSSLPAIINVQPPAAGVPFTFNIPIATSQSEDVVYSIAPTSISDLYLASPVGLTIDSTTGIVTWAVPTGKPLGYYALQIKVDTYVSGVQHSFITLDFIMNLLAPSNYHPPQWTAITPAQGSVINAVIGVTLNIPIGANDVDGSVVTITNAGIPAHSVWTSTSGINSVANLAFTPVTSQAGVVYVVSLTATEPHGLAVYRSFSIVVSVHPPQFDLPTPTLGATIKVVAGHTATIPIAASDPLDGSSVRITVIGSLPSGASFTNSIGVSATGLITFSPTNSQAGSSYIIQLQAAEPHNLLATTTFAIQVISPSANGDPQFTGFAGQSYQVHGVSQTVYNIISSPSLQYNALFSYLESGSCRKGTPCFSHPGNYFGEVGMLFAPSTTTASPVEVLVQSGSVKDGLTVIMNNATLPIGSTMTAGSYKLTVVSAFEVVIDSQEFSIRIQNSDYFLNQDVEIGNELLNRIGQYKIAMKSKDNVKASELLSTLPHGVLGQTYMNKVYPNRWKYIEGQLFDYQVQDGIMGTQFKFNRF